MNITCLILLLHVFKCRNSSTDKNSSSRDRIWTADFFLRWIAFKGSTVSAKHRPSDFNKPWPERTARSGTGCSTKERKTKNFLLIFKHGKDLFNLSEQVKVLHLCSVFIFVTLYFNCVCHVFQDILCLRIVLCPVATSLPPFAHNNLSYSHITFLYSFSVFLWVFVWLFIFGHLHWLVVQ